MIYIHVPFCRSFCTYCGFYSEICSRSAPQQVQNRFFEDYADALCAEIEARRAEISAARRGLAGSAEMCPAGSRTASDPSQASLGPSLSRAEGGTSLPDTPPASPSGPAVPLGLAGSCGAPDTLYIGGGTPSVLPFDLLKRIVSALGPSDYEEFTVEVNPDDLVSGGPSYVAALRGLGVNRISMGVQSFDDGILRWMNRRHDAAEAREAFRLLRAAGFDNISIDLISGLSQLSDGLWEKTVTETLALRPEHISAYQLSIEEDSALEAMVKDGRYSEATDEQCRRQYDTLCRLLADAGYVHYEVSNWALPGREAVHNSAYWRRVPYVGLGPGAHSFSLPEPDADGSCLSVPGAHSFSLPEPGDSGSCPSESAAHSLPLPDSCPICFPFSGIRSWNSQELARRDSSGNLHFWHRDSETLSEREAAEETIMLALRTSRGLTLVQLRALSQESSIDDLLADGSLVLIPSPFLYTPAVDSPSSSLIPSAPQNTDPLTSAGTHRAFSSSHGTSVPQSTVHLAPTNSSSVDSGILSVPWVRIPEDRFFVSDSIISRLFPAG